MSSYYLKKPTSNCIGGRKVVTRRIIPPRTKPDMAAVARYLARHASQPIPKFKTSIKNQKSLS